MKQTMSARNKAFWAKPKSEQRISVAIDVLAQIKSKFYRPERGSYFDVVGLKKDIRGIPKKLDKVFDLLKKGDATCEVCGIGACFTSLVRLGNSVESKDVFEDNILGRHDCISDRDMRPLLRKVFSRRQIALIECAFEMSPVFDDSSKKATYESRQKARDFGGSYQYDTDRLTAIMENIIRNKGTFHP